MSNSRLLNDGTTALAIVNPDGTNLDGTGGTPLTATAVGTVTATAVGTVTANVAGVAAAAGLRFYGFAAAENAGSAAAAEFILRHGDDAADAILYPVTLAADESTSDVFPEPGIDTPNGIYVDWVSGSFTLVLYTKVVA